jgi:hypothetical protein
MASDSKAKTALAELVVGIIFILGGVVVIRVGWTLFGETLILIGVLGVVTAAVQAWRARRSASEPPLSN